ncbi:MAG: hypothetical protein KDA85_20395, partial [Planctomycetaceae bacterium]|nr:hypothetical protein [Planctomycetaceae bacterium]
MTGSATPEGNQDDTEKKQVHGTMLPPAMGSGQQARVNRDTTTSAASGAGTSTASGQERPAGTRSSPSGTIVAPPLSAIQDTHIQPTAEPPLVMRTHRADTSQMNMIAQIARTCGPAKLDTVPSPTLPRMRRTTDYKAGKSTWNLRIHCRGVAGQISGIINDISSTDHNAVGLASALVHADAAPEYEIQG